MELEGCTVTRASTRLSELSKRMLPLRALRLTRFFSVIPKRSSSIGNLEIRVTTAAFFRLESSIERHHIVSIYTLFNFFFYPPHSLAQITIPSISFLRPAYLHTISLMWNNSIGSKDVSIFVRRCRRLSQTHLPTSMTSESLRAVQG